MRISIVMTYFNRRFQLNRTLLSLKESAFKNFNVIIVDDASYEVLSIDEKYPFRIDIINIKPEEKVWTNPEPAYNKGILKALEFNPDVIVLQNAECYHNGDILSYIESNISNKNYLSFGCFSLDEKTTFSDHALNDVVHANNCGAIIDGENAWYNHSIYRPVAYDFCSAITVDNLKKLNGYDERFSNGCAYGDNYLLNRIRMLGLNVEIIDYPFAVHQWHYTNPSVPNKQALVDRNSNLLIELTAKGEFKAEHIYTPDL